MTDKINITKSSISGVSAIGRNSIASNSGTVIAQAKVAPFVDMLQFARLSEDLLKHGVEQQDIADLHAAIASDSTSKEVSEKKVGPAVNSWMEKMFQQAVSAAWQINIGAAGSILATAILRYYGWS